MKPKLKENVNFEQLKNDINSSINHAVEDGCEPDDFRYSVTVQIINSLFENPNDFWNWKVNL